MVSRRHVKYDEEQLKCGLEERRRILEERIQQISEAQEKITSAISQSSYKKALDSLGFSGFKDFRFICSDVPYAKGMHNLRASLRELEDKHPGSSLHPLFEVRGKMIPRPLTFEETVRYMVEDWNTKTKYGKKRTEQERVRLFTESFKDTCTGVVNKKNSTKFKIIPECSQLILLPENFNEEFVRVNYEDFKDCEELDSSKGKFCVDLDRTGFGKNKGWIHSIPDNDLRKEFGDVVYYLLDKFRNGRTDGAGFYVRQNTAQDELRAAFVHNLDNLCDADAGNSRNDNSSFLRVARAPKK